MVDSGNIDNCDKGISFIVIWRWPREGVGMPFPGGIHKILIVIIIVLIYFARTWNIWIPPEIPLECIFSA